MATNSDLNQLKKIADKRGKAHVSWMRNLLILFSSLFGILVALHRQSPQDGRVSHYIFYAAIALLPLGILFGSVYLYEEVDGLRRLQKSWAGELISSDQDGRNPKIVALQRGKFFVVSEIACYVLLALSLLLLSLYAVLMVFN